MEASFGQGFMAETSEDLLSLYEFKAYCDSPDDKDHMKCACNVLYIIGQC